MPDVSMLETLPYGPPKYVAPPLPFATIDLAELEPLPEPAVRPVGPHRARLRHPRHRGDRWVEKWGESISADRPEYVAR
jgi:hypothetical protein